MSSQLKQISLIGLFGLKYQSVCLRKHHNHHDSSHCSVVKPKMAGSSSGVVCWMQTYTQWIYWCQIGELLILVSYQPAANVKPAHNWRAASGKLDVFVTKVYHWRKSNMAFVDSGSILVKNNGRSGSSCYILHLKAMAGGRFGSQTQSITLHGVNKNVLIIKNKTQ